MAHDGIGGRMEIVAKEYDGVQFKLESLVQLVLVSKALWIKLLFAATFSGKERREEIYNQSYNRGLADTTFGAV